ncbi:MAG: SDR family NAD(P)-dependent oxidoreductase [Hyphomicrobium sp.]
MKILIIGASRGIGLETVKAALAAGHQVRAFARSAAALPIEHPQLQKFTGDALDRANVERALEGMDAVAQVLGLAMGPAYIGGTELFSKATRELVDAMGARGPKRLVVVTGLGAGDSRGSLGLYAIPFMIVLKRVYDDKDVQERIVRNSALDWTILRPGVLQDGPATGAARVLADAKDWRPGPVRRADVARAIVDELETGRNLRRTPAVVG